MLRKSLNDLGCKAQYHSSFPLGSFAEERPFYQRIQPSSCYGIRTWPQRVLVEQYPLDRHANPLGQNELGPQAPCLSCWQRLRFQQMSSGLPAKVGP